MLFAGTFWHLKSRSVIKMSELDWLVDYLFTLILFLLCSTLRYFFCQSCTEIISKVLTFTWNYKLYVPYNTTFAIKLLHLIWHFLPCDNLANIMGISSLCYDSTQKSWNVCVVLQDCYEFVQETTLVILHRLQHVLQMEVRSISFF